MRRAGLACAVAAAVGLAAPGVVRAAVDDYLGKTVTSVRLDLEGRETVDPRLVEVVETRVGRPLSMVEVRESLTHLFSLGRFEDVRVHASGAGGAVALRYELVPIHTVAQVELEGRIDAPGVDKGQLRRAVFDRYGASPPLARAGEVARLVADALRRRGYLHAAVTPRTEIAHDPERATLALVIDPGVRTEIGSVEVTGLPPASHRELLDRLDVASGRPYEREALEERIGRYIESLKSRGFYEATADAVVRLADGDRIANLTLAVRSGPLVRVVFAGDPLPADRREEFVPIAREGSADEDLLEDSGNRIEEYLKAQGYRDAVARHLRREANDQLTITFDVNKGPQYRVSRVEVTGNAGIPLSELGAGLRTREGQPFSAARLEADVLAIEEMYRRLGFAAAKLQTAVEVPPSTTGAVPVVVRILVREGIRTMVGSLRIEGNRSVPEGRLREGLALEAGRPFVAAQLPVDRDAIALHYANLGYQSATVDANPGLSADGTRADVVFAVREGPLIVVGHVLIVGNVRTRAGTIQRELQVKPGDPLSLAAVNESQRRLVSLGLFRRVRIAELRHGDETTRDLLVTVEEAPATTVGYGAGGEGRVRVVRRAEDGGIASQRLEFAPRGSFEIGRRNLFGKNRSVSFFSGVTLYPKDSPFFKDKPSVTSDGGYGFAQYRVLGTFREPRVLGTAADAFVTGVMEQQIRSSFNFSRRSVGLEVARRLTRQISASGNYQIQQTRVFDAIGAPADQLLIDRIFPQVRLSSFSSAAILDARDDAVEPASGRYVSVNGQLAGRAIGSEVGFAKTFVTAQLFRTLPQVRRIVFAGNARLGMANGFPREVVRLDDRNQPAIDVVKALPASERFFAGGDTTVRGFALDQLGTRHEPSAPNDTLDKDRFPLGGNAVIILNAELRVPVKGGLGVVGFFDTGNVFAHVADVDLTALRSAIGFGVRYKSPVGPIRVDLGFKVRRLPYACPTEADPARGCRESLTALHISFGQAF